MLCISVKVTICIGLMVTRRFGSPPKTGNHTPKQVVIFTENTQQGGAGSSQLHLGRQVGACAYPCHPAAGARQRHSVRSMAAEVGISPDSVHRIWRANDIKLHLVEVFKMSTDPRFEEKFWDVIGLYLDPPERSLVLCCDEKSPCQALERSPLSLPLAIGKKRTRTHDYKRHGTITLFAALNYWYSPAKTASSSRAWKRAIPTSSGCASSSR